MPRPNPEIIKRAIEDAQQTYDELHKQLLAKLEEAEGIKDNLNKLEAFINPAKALLSLAVGSETKAVESPPQTASLKPSTFIEEKPLLQGGIEILKEAGRPMHLSEIVDEFRKRRWKLSEKNGREVLRFTFKKHLGSIFMKTKTGQYGLKEPVRVPQLTPKPIIRHAVVEPPKEQ